MLCADADLMALLKASAAPTVGEPWEAWYGFVRLALADWLEEHGKEHRVTALRQARPEIEWVLPLEPGDVLLRLDWIRVHSYLVEPRPQELVLALRREADGLTTPLWMQSIRVGYVSHTFGPFTAPVVPAEHRIVLGLAEAATWPVSATVRYETRAGDMIEATEELQTPARVREVFRWEVIRNHFRDVAVETSDYVGPASGWVRRLEDQARSTGVK